ncbi:hypothetical protein DVH24_025649 [Malus domestica]|uniref:Wall-associated receptor kinase galacturonan-binding domain-containing protein n=1 Tax=Malus domestica TaxID=3750 RepID=A0A498KMH9_MALDO|nr:hypothetical protein DVH24_025649 [Malus domestica]
MEISGSRSFTLSLAFLLLCFCSETCAKSCTSSCGHNHNISYPFRLDDDPKHCGNVMYTLSCESNITVLDIPSSGKYYVQAINYDKKTIRIVDFGLQSNDCSSMPQNIPPNTNLYWSWPSTSIYYLMCSNPLNSSLYVDTAPCLNNTSSSSQPKTYSYVKVGEIEVWDLDEGCSAEWMTLAPVNYVDYSNVSYKDIHNALMYGFDLGFETPYAIRCQGKYWIGSYVSTCFPQTISGFFQFLWQQITGKLSSLLHNDYIGKSFS